jgi:hypothetical protein
MTSSAVRGEPLAVADTKIAPLRRNGWSRSDNSGILFVNFSNICCDSVRVGKFHVPVTTYQTPPALVRRRLLDYDRDSHLMPLIYTYCKQEIRYGRGELVSITCWLSGTVVLLYCTGGVRLCPHRSGFDLRSYAIHQCCRLCD